MDLTRAAKAEKRVVEEAAEKAINSLPLLFLFILISTSAYNIQSTDFNIELGAASSKVSAELTVIHQYSPEEVKFSIPEQILNIETYVNGQPVDWWFENSDIVINYNQPSGTHQVNIIYHTDLVTYSEKGYMYSFTYTTKNPTQLNLNIMLPTHATLSRDMATAPKPQISSDGEHIILSWNRDLSVGSTFSVAGMYNPPSKDLGILSILAVLVLIAVIVVFLYKKQADNKLLLVLSEDERLIYKKIKEIPGITQKEVEEFTGFSKAKVSKLIRNLEKSNLIKKQPYKKTNKLWVK